MLFGIWEINVTDAEDGSSVYSFAAEDRILYIGEGHEGLPEPENDEDNFIPIKSMKRKCGKSSQLSYVQVGEYLSPINIPIPTPASDRGGPVACIGGPVPVCLSGAMLLMSALARARRNVKWLTARKHE